MSQQKLTIFGIVGLLIFGGLALSIFGGINVGSAIRAGSWPTAKGTITSSHVKSGIETNVRRTGASKQTKQTVNIEYEYEIDGTPYQNNVVFASGVMPRSMSAANALAMQYRTGQSVDVYYNPDQPDQAVLDRSWGVMPVIACLLGPLMSIGGLAAVPYAIRYNSPYRTFAEQHAAMEREQAIAVGKDAGR